MAQYQFREKTHRQVVSEKLMYYYDLYVPIYRTQVPRYLEKVKEREELGIRRGNIHPESTIAKYPKIPSFEIDSRDEAAEYIDSLTKVELDRLIHNVKETLGSHNFKRMIDEFYDMDFTNRRTRRQHQSRN